MSRARPTRSLWTPLATLPVILTAIVILQMRIDARTRTASQQHEELLLRSPATLKRLSLGYDALLADVYWTRAVQYYGERFGKRGAQFDLLWPLLDITTTLDPKLMAAYRFGAIFLSEPDWGANRPDLAVALVQRGIAANPDEWHLYADLGFLYYWWLQDYPHASAAYLEASKNPKAPSWLKMMAARVAEKGGSLDTSRMIWSEILSSTKDPAVRKRAEETMKALKALQDEINLDALAETYQKRFGRYPSATAELRDAGLLPGIPVDPEGYAYVFGPGGKSRLNPKSPVVIPPPPRTRAPVSK